MKAIINPIITSSVMKNFILGRVMIFIFLFKSSISNNRANGAQYIITRISWDVAKGIPIIVAGASNVYKYMGVSNANSYIVP